MRITSYYVATTCIASAALILPNLVGRHSVLNALPTAVSSAFGALPHKHSRLPGVLAMSADRFLSSLGVNTHVDQGYDPNSYVEPLKFTGIREVRDGSRHISSDVMIHQKTGARFTIGDGGDLHLENLLACGRTLAKADALLALEGPNEVNNFPIVYNGEHGGGQGKSWIPVAQYQKDLYAAAKSDPVLKRYPVFSPSETGAETDNVGLQFLTVPVGAETIFPDKTQFANYVNPHNYVSGNGNQYGDNQAWNAADPTLNSRWDGLYGNNGVTWAHHYRGYTNQQLPDVARVTTETGWDTVINAGGEHTQGTILTNTYLAQFKRGWHYTFIYEMRDDEGGTGKQGLYHKTTPKLAAIYIHNLTTILADSGQLAHPRRLAYSIENEPETVHDLLLQKSTGAFELVVWDERAKGGDNVTVALGAKHRIVKIYDVTSGTEPVQVLRNVRSVPLSLSDHAMIIEVTR
jgi:hypothetical protein